MKEKYSTVLHPFALPPFTHLRLEKKERPSVNTNTQQVSRSGSFQENIGKILNVQQQKSDMAPFDTGVHAHRNVPGISPPVNPYVQERQRRAEYHTSERSLSQVSEITSTDDLEIQTVSETCGNMQVQSAGVNDSGGLTSGNNIQSVNSSVFQYAYSPDGLHICPVQRTPRIIPTELIKVERHDPRYHVKLKKICSNANVKVKSEDSTDSE